MKNLASTWSFSSTFDGATYVSNFDQVFGDMFINSEVLNGENENFEHSADVFGK